MDETTRTVREERQALGWSQELLAKKAGCDVRTVRRLEAGARVSQTTLAEITGALKRGRPVEVKPPSVSVEAAATPPTVSVSNPPAAEPTTGEETKMVESNKAETEAAAPQVETFGDLLALHERDPNAAEQAILDMMPKARAPESTNEKLSMGYQVVDFLERFPDAQVYVFWDAEDPEMRKTLAMFISSAVNVQKAIDHRGFNSAQRFEAQCAFADHLNDMHKNKWRVVGVVRRDWDLEGYCTVTGHIAIDQGI